MEVPQLLAARLAGILKDAMESHQELDLPPRPSINSGFANQVDSLRQVVRGVGTIS